MLFTSRTNKSSINKKNELVDQVDYAYLVNLQIYPSILAAFSFSILSFP